MDDLEFDLGPSEPKRPRVGRQARDLLEAVERDTASDARLKNIRSALLRIGELRTYQDIAFSTLFKNQALSVASLISANPTSGVHIVLESAANVPSSAGLLAAALAIARPSLGEEFLEALALGLARQLHLAIVSRCGTPARLLLRFAAALAATGILSIASVISQLAALTAAATAADLPSRDGVWLAYAAASALPWSCNPADSSLSALGGGDPLAAGDVQRFLDETRAAVTRLEPARGATGLHYALTEDRQVQLDAMFDAAPTDAGRAALPALAASPLAQLLAAIDDALSAGLRRRGGGAGAARDGEEPVAGDEGDAAGSSPFCCLAVCSVARPADDVGVASLVLKPPKKWRPAPPPADAARAAALGIARDGEGVGDAQEDGPPRGAEGVPMEEGCGGPAAPDAADDAEGVDEDAADATPVSPPLALPLVRWEGGVWTCDASAAAIPPADAVFPVASPDDLLVRPAFHLFGGPSGLSATAPLMAAMGLDGPSATPLALWALREVAHDTLLTYFPLQGAAAEALTRLPQGAIVGARGGRALPVFPIVLDCALSQACWLPRPPHPPVFYSLVIARLVTLAASDGAGCGADHATVVVGMAARVLWKYAHLLDDCVLDRLAGLFAHHVSINRWDWVWADWARVLLPGSAAPPHSPQRRLLSALLNRTFALVGPYHYERIVSAHMPQGLREAGLLPVSVTVAAQSPLLPAVAADAAPGAPPAPLLALATEVTAKLRAKAEAAELSAWLAARADADAATGITPLLSALTVAHCILVHGRANLKHAQTLVERYKPLLRAGGGAGSPLSLDVHAHTVLAAVWEVWRRAQHVALALCELLVQLGVVSPAQLVSFALAPRVRFPAGHWNASDEAQPGDSAGEEERDEGSATAAAPLEHTYLRSLRLQWWELAAKGLELGAAAAGAARVALAVFRGVGILDPKDDELTIPVAEEKDAQLAAAAANAEGAAAAAVVTAVELCSAAVAQLLDASAGVGGDAAAGYAEATRVVLAHLRDVCRAHAPALREASAGGALASARARCGHVAQALDAALAYVPAVRAVPSPLVRDTLLVAASQP